MPAYEPMKTNCSLNGSYDDGEAWIAEPTGVVLSSPGYRFVYDAGSAPVEVVPASERTRYDV